jgi:hypothetical protein
MTQSTRSVVHHEEGIFEDKRKLVGVAPSSTAFNVQSSGVIDIANCRGGLLTSHGLFTVVHTAPTMVYRRIP